MGSSPTIGTLAARVDSGTPVVARSRGGMAGMMEEVLVPGRRKSERVRFKSAVGDEGDGSTFTVPTILGCAENTVKVHPARIFEKLGFESAQRGDGPGP
ncbi:MAG: hypothetical protein IT365_24175 [Candidatus Hydrogenedentes bacterium]|nr:hypothetical protein [Candidatus Hydrogenedentota bacterium]